MLAGGAVAALSLALLGHAAVASAASGDDLDDLRAALASCTATEAAPFEVDLLADLIGQEVDLGVACAVELELGRHRFTVRSIALAPAIHLRIRDSGSAAASSPMRGPCPAAGPASGAPPSRSAAAKSQWDC